MKGLIKRFSKTNWLRNFVSRILFLSWVIFMIYEFCIRKDNSNSMFLPVNSFDDFILDVIVTFISSLIAFMVIFAIRCYLPGHEIEVISDGGPDYHSFG